MMWLFLLPIVDGSSTYVAFASSTHNGNFGGLAGADAYCDNQGKGKWPTKSFLALLSTSTGNAKDRIPYVNYVNQGNSLGNGQTIWSNGLNNALSYDVNGNSLWRNIWTGSHNDGTYRSPTCNDWTSTSGSGSQGSTSSSSTSSILGWIEQSATWGCGNSIGVYCFERVLCNTLGSGPGVVISETNGGYYPSTASFSCRLAAHVQIGAASATCGPTLAWTASIPTCLLLWVTGAAFNGENWGFSVWFNRLPSPYSVTSCDMSAIFASSTLAIIGTASCQWFPSGSGAELRVNQFIPSGWNYNYQINFASIFDLASSSDPLVNSSVQIKLPAPPVAQITAPLQIGSCADLQADGSGSTGNGDFPFQYSWTVSWSGGPSVLSTQNSVKIPQTHPMLQPTNTQPITITLVVYNLYGQASAPAVVVVQKKNTWAPIVSLPSLVPVTIGDTLLLNPSVQFPVCGNSNETDLVIESFRWHLVSGPALLGAVSLDSRVLSFQVGSTLPTIGLYVFTLNVTAAHNNVLVSCTVSYSHSPISVNIRRVTSSDVGGVKLDGSTSRDPDSSLTLPGSPLLSFLWSCMVTAPEPGNATVGVVTFVPYPCPLNTSVAVNTGTLQLSAQQVRQLGSATFTFTLTVSSTIFPGPPRSGSQSINVVLDPGSSDAQVTINGPTSSVYPSTQLTLSAQMLPSSAAQSATYAWRETQQSLASVPANATATFQPPILSSEYFLTLPPLTLQAGRWYTFEVTATTSLGSARGNYYLFVQNPPSGGACLTSPLNGTILTLFQLECWNWLNLDSTPLQYSFAYQLLPVGMTSLPVNSSQLPEIGLTDASFMPWQTVALPSGMVSLIAYIISGSGSVRYRFPALVEVEDPRLSITNLTALQNLTSEVQAAVDSALQFQDYSLALDTISAAAPVLCGNYSWYGNTTGQADAVQKVWTSLFPVLTVGSSSTTSTVVDEATAVQIALSLAYLTQATTRQQANSTLKQLLQTLATLTALVTSDTPVLGSLLSSTLEWVLNQVSCVDLPQAITIWQNLHVNSQIGQPCGSSTGSNAATCLFADSNQVVASQQVSLPESLLSQADTLDPLTDRPTGVLLVQQYGDNVLRCRSTGQGILSGILSLDIANDGGRVSTSPITDGRVMFYMPVDQKASQEYQAYESALNSAPVLCGDGSVRSAAQTASDSGANLSTLPFQCGWWNQTASLWETSGCEAGNLTVTENTTGSLLQCYCNHLTDFTILLREGSSLQPPLPGECPINSSTYAGMYGSFAVFYLLLGAYTAFVVGTIVYHQQKRCQPTTLLVEHILILTVCLARALSCGRYANVFSTPFVFAGLVSSLPYAIMFWVYTLMVFQWAGIFHLSMKHKNTFQVVRPLFLVCNAVVTIVVVTSFALLTGAKLSLAGSRKAALAGSVLLALIYCIAGFAFVVYAVLLGGTMKSTESSGTSSTVRNSSPRPTAARSSAHQRQQSENIDAPPSKSAGLCHGCRTLRLSSRMMVVGVVVSVCFMVESLLLSISIPSVEGLVNSAANDAAAQGAFFCFDIVGLITLLYIFQRGIDQLKRQSKRNTTGGISLSVLTGSAGNAGKSPENTKMSLKVRGAPSFRKPATSGTLDREGGTGEQASVAGGKGGEETRIPVPPPRLDVKVVNDGKDREKEGVANAVRGTESAEGEEVAQGPEGATGTKSEDMQEQRAEGQLKAISDPTNSHSWSAFNSPHSTDSVA